MKLLTRWLLLFSAVALCRAQLTPDQKVADFLHLSGTFAKNYGPYEWKRDVIRFDLMKVAPWLERVRATRSDLDFYELCVEYIARLNDAHSSYELPASFSASLGFSVDVYDDKVLVESISRTRLPAASYPFQIGDELVSIDGAAVEDLARSFEKYNMAANERATRRFSVSSLTFRPQWVMPHAHEIAEAAGVVIRRQSGALESYSIPWRKSGIPLTSAGPVPSPEARGGTRRAAAWDEPAYARFLNRLRNVRLPDARAVLNFGARSPIFAPPDGFSQRLGRAASDAFYSGTFSSGGFRIGFIRIPNYDPPDMSLALRQFDSEIRYFRDSTDGLIIDQMRNPGGDACYVETLASYIIPYEFRTLGFEIRATSNWVAEAAAALDDARSLSAPGWVIELLEALVHDLETANRENRGRTGPLPLCSVSLTLQPARVAYDKPILLVVDELAGSGGDMLPAVFQDAGRGPMLGWRTMGAGGNVAPFQVGAYSEGRATLTESLMVRKEPVTGTEYPDAPYIENIGVRPDLWVDYMTKENLLNRGRPFVDTMVDEMVKHIRNSQ